MNTIETIADKINAFGDRFKLDPAQVTVTSYEQMGPNVRVFYTVDATYGKSPEEIKKMVQKQRLCNQLIADPFAEGNETEPEVPEVPEVKPTSLTITAQNDVKVGDTFAIGVDMLPADAADKTFTTTVTPEGIVTLINGGTSAMAVAEGSVQITVTSNASPTVKSTKVVAVAAATVDPRQLSISQIESNLEVGQESTVEVTFDPADTTNKDFILESSNTSVATISGNKVTAVAAGTANIIARSVAKPSVVSAASAVVVTVPVIDPVSINLKVTAANFTGNEAEVNDSFKVSATVLPAGADQEVTYSVDPTGIVMDMGNGEYICEAEGTVTITATSVSKPTVKQTFVLNVAPDSPINEG